MLAIWWDFMEFREIPINSMVFREIYQIQVAVGPENDILGSALTKHSEGGKWLNQWLASVGILNDFV